MTFLRDAAPARTGGQKNTLLVTNFFTKSALEGKKHSLLQTFCKKAQWRAKKLRERGSNTARQPRKGGGVSRFGRDSVAFRSRFGRDWVIRSRRFMPILSRKRNFIFAFCRNRSRFGRNRSRFGRVSVAIRSPDSVAFRSRFARDSVAIGRDSVS